MTSKKQSLSEKKQSSFKRKKKKKYKKKIRKLEQNYFKKSLQIIYRKIFQYIKENRKTNGTLKFKIYLNKELSRLLPDMKKESKEMFESRFRKYMVANMQQQGYKSRLSAISYENKYFYNSYGGLKKDRTINNVFLCFNLEFEPLSEESEIEDFKGQLSLSSEDGRLSLCKS